MKKFTFLAIALLIGFCAAEAAAQFEIKLPKWGKPKTEKPKTEQPNAEQPKAGGAANQNPSKKAVGDVGYMSKPQPTNVPVLLKNTVEIRAERSTQRRADNDTNHGVWTPAISFEVFHDQSEIVRYTIEWLKPDGSLWFREPVDGNRNRVETATSEKYGIDVAGVYGFRLSNTKSKEVLLQGKFKVVKFEMPSAAVNRKPMASFYIDYDWLLPFGYVGFEDNTSWQYDPAPTVYLWFKGDLKREDFEARLFHNNRQILSTDDPGAVIRDGTNTRNGGAECFDKREICTYRLWQFEWNLRVASFAPNELGRHTRRPEHLYTQDMPGEYTVKVFHKGVQVRETKFTVEPKGYLAANPFAAQMPMKNRLVLIPVKVSGTLDKWTPAAWKTEAFFGNPVTGFVAP